jgi:hypothetical protein
MQPLQCALARQRTAGCSNFGILLQYGTSRLAALGAIRPRPAQ